MDPRTPTLPDLSRLIAARARGLRRLIVAIAGAPGSGKSTLTDWLARDLNAAQPGLAEVMPMDGYHLDNGVLSARGLLDRKGAPQTFDAQALIRDLARVRAATVPVLVPVFDRHLDLARAAGREIAPATPVILLEGNYLLLDAQPWTGLAPLCDLTLFLDVPEAELERRLIRRWIDHGHDPAAARARALGNDIPNARLVARHSRPAEIRIAAH